MQCVPKYQVSKKAKQSQESDDAEDDDDDSGDLGLSALPSGLLEEHKEEAEAKAPLAKLQTLYAFSGALMVVVGVAAFAARQQVCRHPATHQTLCAEEGFQEEAM